MVLQRIEQLEEVPAPTRPAFDSPSGRHAARLLPLSGLASGGALALAAVGIGIVGHRLRTDLESRPITLVELDAGRSQAQLLQAATITLGVVGGALVVTSAAVLLATGLKGK